jgi:hypothetical protein
MGDSTEKYNASTLGGLQSSASLKRLSLISNLRSRGVGDHIDLPQLVVSGDQSTGKSSVLEGITGVPFPRQDGLCTRFATEITLEHTDAGINQPTFQLPAMPIRLTVRAPPSRNPARYFPTDNGKNRLCSQKRFWKLLQIRTRDIDFRGQVVLPVADPCIKGPKPPKLGLAWVGVGSGRPLIRLYLSRGVEI